MSTNLRANLIMGAVFVAILGLLAMVIIGTQTDKQAAATHLTDLEQERDAWRAAGTVALKRLAYQDTLFLDQTIMVVPEHLQDIGLFRGEDVVSTRELQISVSLQGDRTFRLTFTPEGRVDDIRLLPLTSPSQELGGVP